MRIYSLNIIHVILVRLYIQSAVDDVQMSLRQCSRDDRRNNRGRRRYGRNATRNIRLGRLTAVSGLLLRILHSSRLIIVILCLALLLVHKQAAGMTVSRATDLARVRFLACMRESMLL